MDDPSLKGIIPRMVNTVFSEVRGPEESCICRTTTMSLLLTRKRRYVRLLGRTFDRRERGRLEFRERERERSCREREVVWSER